MLYCLDTSVCVHLIRGRAPALDLPPAADCRISVITAAELEVGLLKSSRPTEQRRVVRAFLSLFQVLPWETSAVSHYGEIRADLERRGLAIGPLDMLVAAHARSLGATLVTGNSDEFRRVKGLKVLAWE